MSFQKPAKEVIIISLEDALEILNIELFDAMGREIVLPIHGAVINIGKLPTGIYTLKIQTNESWVKRKFIKE